MAQPLKLEVMGHVAVAALRLVQEAPERRDMTAAQAVRRAASMAVGQDGSGGAVAQGGTGRTFGGATYSTGGNGGIYAATGNGASALPNTGNGGAGGGSASGVAVNGGNGGSGIVIVRWVTP